MLQFIKLTEPYYNVIEGREVGAETFINVDSIVAFQSNNQSFENERTGVYTTDGRVIEVTETPEEIVKKLGLVPAEK